MAGIEKTYRKVPLAGPHRDCDHWMRRPHEERLAALEELRREYHRFKYGAEPRLQRVYSIVQR